MELGFDTVGLAPGKPVQVDEQLRAVAVAGDWLYAVGDCNGGAMLTHMGKYHARIAADVILGKDVADRASSDVVPRVTFTDPQVAAVGLIEDQARERGIDVQVVTYGNGDVPGAQVLGNGIAGTRNLVIDELSRRDPPRHIHRTRRSGAAAFGDSGNCRCYPAAETAARRTGPDGQRSIDTSTEEYGL
jgi:pyruvate/2-oxoglutarate dehydrogenase complex dihydrolipoamide dehydrogenase (E3) component